MQMDWFVVTITLLALPLILSYVNGRDIPTTLEGPFDPVTIPLDTSSRGNAVDLPDNDYRVQRRVQGFNPEQISVSLSSNHDSVWISWITVLIHIFAGDYQIGYNIKPLNPKKVQSVVRYGRSPFRLNHEEDGDSLIYSQLYPYEDIQNYTSGIIHHVRLTDLKPETIYYYRCGDPSRRRNMSEVHYFKTMPASGLHSYPAKIAIVGDLGLTYNTTSTIDHMMSNDPDLILLIGDVTYAELYLTNNTGSDCFQCSFPDSPRVSYQPRWDYFGRYMEPVISKVPMMVIEGNHDIEPQAENQTFAAYSSRFAFPSKESKSKSTLYYSFNAGGIHFIMLGSYITYNKKAHQYKWLKRDLAKVDKNVTPWLVASWHSPWYSTYKAHYREAECMRVAMEELLYEYGVDIVFNGHVHAYERSNRVFNYTYDPCGPVHITIGDGGNREDRAIEHADELNDEGVSNCPEPLSTPDKFMGGYCAFNFTSGPAKGKFCWDKQPDYSAYRDSSFGHGILEVKNETHALWTWHRNQDLYNEAGDQIYIVRQPDRCPSELQVKINPSIELRDEA